MTFAGAIASDSTQTCSHSSVHGAAHNLPRRQAFPFTVTLLKWPAQRLPLPSNLDDSKSLRLPVWQIWRLPGKSGTPGVTRISPSLIALASL